MKEDCFCTLEKLLKDDILTTQVLNDLYHYTIYVSYLCFIPSSS